MLARFLMLAATLFIVSACSSTDDESLVDGSGVAGQSADGPLSDIYDGSGSGVAPGTQADLVTNVGDRIFFGYDRYDLTPEARTVLDNQANWLQQYPNLHVTIEGHSDERGTREYNLALGERRANSVKNYLVATGVGSDRLTTISYGKERPAVAAASEDGWAQNRRGVTKVD